MPIPQKILSVKRPKNTIVIAYGKDKNLYAVRQRIGCKNINGRHVPVNGPTIGHIIDGRYVAVEENVVTAVSTSDVELKDWASVEFVGGTASFLKKIYDEILSFKDAYWSVINQGLFHVGDEMLTSIALARLRKKQNLCPVDAKWFGVIHRYWSAFESRSIWSHGTFLIHLPGDKMFEAQVDLSAKTVNDIFTGYNWFRKK